MPDRYEFFDHAADVGVRIRAASRIELFRLAAGALMECIGPEPPGPAAAGRLVTLEAADQEELLVRWLQELIFVFQCDHVYATQTDVVRLTARRLQASVSGVRWDDASGGELREVKAVTYHKLQVERRGRIWHACFILDV